LFQRKVNNGGEMLGGGLSRGDKNPKKQELSNYDKDGTTPRKRRKSGGEWGGEMGKSVLGRKVPTWEKSTPLLKKGKGRGPGHNRSEKRYKDRLFHRKTQAQAKRKFGDALAGKGNVGRAGPWGDVWGVGGDHRMQTKGKTNKIGRERGAR